MDDREVQHFIEHKLKSLPKIEQIRSMNAIVVTPSLLTNLEKAINTASTIAAIPAFLLLSQITVAAAILE